jgi:predicted O-methyltransferase YrrM
VTEDRYAAVDDHLDALFGLHHTFTDTVRRSDEAGLPAINVSSATGRFLQVLAVAVGARRILEIGTLGGFSTLWLVGALPPDGEVVTLEHDPRHAEVARTNLDAAGVGDRVEIRVGDALTSLSTLREEDGTPFDLVFLDADKESYVAYLDATVPLCRPGSLLVADNVVRHGRILDPDTDDTFVQGVQRFNEALAHHPALEARAILQIVGQKGHDGLAFGVVADPTATR